MTRYMTAVASLGRYRLRTMQAVQAALGDDLVIAAGTVPYDTSIKVLSARDLPMVEVVNHFGPGGLLWQGIPWRQALKAETLLIDLNPRVLSNWVLLGARRLLGRRTLLWGHAFPRAGKGARSDTVRGLMRSLADGLVSYTRTQAEELRRLHRKTVYVAPNALYLRSEMGFEPAPERRAVIYVGRLQADKKIALLIEGFAAAAERCAGMRLIVVGDGTQAASLRARAASLPCSDRITFAGHVDDIEALRGFYAQAFVSVSPGYVGLSITQSLAFGVPMLIARNENHSPEIEAAQEGQNCQFFSSDDPEALADGLLNFWRGRDQWRARGQEISASCARDYSVEAMAEGIVAAFKGR